MSDVVIVADAGSTHMGKAEYVIELVERAREANASCIKFQLFKGEQYTKAGNVELHRDLFKEAFATGRRVGIPVTASVFDDESQTFLQGFPDVHHIKFGFSRRHEYKNIVGALTGGHRVVVTTDGLTVPKYQNHRNLILLFTQLNGSDVAYPATGFNAFEGMFPNHFQGFSDHSYGIDQAKLAVSYGAKWIEKHIKLDYSDVQQVPDAAFAMGPKDFKRFVREVK